MEMKNNNKTYTILILLSFIMLILNLSSGIFMCIISFFDAFNAIPLIIMLVGFIPILISYLITKRNKNNTQKNVKIWNMFFVIILFIIFILYEFIGFIFFIFAQNMIAIKPSKNRYSKYISTMTEKSYRIKHFPLSIPKNATNYYFIIDRGGQGYWIHYLKFKTDKKYIDDTIIQNQNNVYKKIKFNEVNNYYKFLDDNFNLKNKNETHIYIMKNVNNDNDYTSGIIVTKTNEIIFFYANFNLKL